VSLDLELDDAQRALAEALGAFCRDRCPDERLRREAGTFPTALWRELAELGVLGLAAPDAAEGEGGPLELVAAMEALGRAAFPGPLVATFLAAQLVGPAERERLASGELVVSVGAPPLLPFAPVAELFIEIEGTRAWRARPAGPVEPVDTLGGEPWGRAALEREEDLGDAERALAVYDTALAAYLAAAGQRLVDDTAEHARTRRQFGRPIGDFQAVAHPLLLAFFNKAVHDFWSERFRSTIIEASPEALSTVAAYIDLNPVRAQIVDDPAKYHFSSFGEASGGHRPARRGYESIFCMKKGWEQLLPSYNLILYGKGETAKGSTDKDLGRIDPEKAARVLAAGGQVSIAEALRMRIRYFSAGTALGSRDFLEKLSAEWNALHGTDRTNNAHAMLGAAWGELRSYRNLRKEPLVPPLWTD